METQTKFICTLLVFIQCFILISAQTTWTTESNVTAMRLGSHVIGCDVNGDRHTDIISTGLISAFVYLGNANGEFSSTPSFVLPVLTATTVYTDGLALECADLNQDGFSDVVVGNWTGNAFQTILIYYGMSSGINTEPYSWRFNSNNWYYGCDIAAADYNNDGRMDLAIGSYGYGQIYFHYGTSAGTISPSYTAPSSLFVHQLTYSQNIASCDLSNDHFPDLLVGWRNSNSSQGSLWIYSNVQGSWQSPAKVYWGSVASGGFGVDAKCGDFNADGNKDIAVLAGAERMVYIYYGTGDINTLPNTPSVSLSIADVSKSLSIGDLNNDGFDDIVVGFPQVNQVKVFWGGSGLFTGAVPGFTFMGVTGASGFRVAALPNIDGIGSKDLVFGSYTYTNGETYEGAITVVKNIPLTAVPSSSVTPTPTSTPSASPSTSSSPSSSSIPSSSNTPYPSQCPSFPPHEDSSSSSDSGLSSQVWVVISVMCFLVGIIVGLIIGMAFITKMRTKRQVLTSRDYVALSAYDANSFQDTDQ